MKSQNVCKFPNAPIGNGTLSILRFVQESEIEVMIQPTILLYHRMLLVTKGNGTFKIGQGSHKVSQGSLLFGFANEEFYLSEGDVLYIYIDFEGSRADELLKRFGISPLYRLREGCEGHIPLWQESISRASTETTDLIAESVLLNAFSRLKSDSSADNGIIAKITAITEDNFNDPDLNISYIANELSYNSKYLSSIFKKATGVNYSEYLRSVRLKYAIALFEHGIDSVKNVALLSGFSDSLYFSKVFKSYVGISPTLFIESINSKSKYTDDTDK